MEYTAQQMSAAAQTARSNGHATKTQTQVIQKGLQGNTSKTPEQMLHIIAMALDTSYDSFRIKSRERHIVELRFLGALFLRSNFPMITLQQIAALFGGQDHTSIINGLARAYDLIYTGDDRFVRKYNMALQMVNLWLSNNDEIRS